jgi:hypothetical protein
LNALLDTKRIAERWPENSSKHIAIRTSGYAAAWLLYNVGVIFLPLTFAFLVLYLSLGKGSAITEAVQPRDLFLAGFALLTARLYDLLNDSPTIRKVLLVGTFIVFVYIGLIMGAGLPVIQTLPHARPIKVTVLWPVSIGYVMVTIVLIALTWATKAENTESRPHLPNNVPAPSGSGTTIAKEESDKLPGNDPVAQSEETVATDDSSNAIRRPGPDLAAKDSNHARNEASQD